MHKSYLLWKCGSCSSPSNISGETSSALQVLSYEVKLVWAGAQGDRGELSVNRVGTPVEWVLLVGFAPTCDSVFYYLLTQLEVIKKLICFPKWLVM